MLYAVLRFLVAASFRLCFRLRGHGRTHVPPAGGVIVAANHSSLLDPPAVGAVAPRPLHFMAKAELFRIPLLGALIRRLNAHPVDRSGSDAAALRQALRLLAEGAALLVFPEGTRGPEGTLRPARPGAGMLAALAGVPVVPAYIEGTGRALGRGAVLPRPSRVAVIFGPALTFGSRAASPGGRRDKGRYQAISDEIMAAIGRLKQERERDTAAPGPRATIEGPTTRARTPAGRIH